jgi:hypothetical protein
MAIHIGQTKIHSDAWRCCWDVAVRDACTSGRVGAARRRPSEPGRRRSESIGPRHVFLLHCMSLVVRELEAVGAGKWRFVPACTELNISRLRGARNDHDQVED